MFARLLVRMAIEWWGIIASIQLTSPTVASRVADLPRQMTLVMVYESGHRATMAAKTLQATGFDPSILEGSTAAWRNAGKSMVSADGASWSLERQVRLGAGTLVLTGVVLGSFVDRRWLALSGFVGAGLAFAGLTNVCGMAKVLQKMPWNQAKDSSNEAPERQVAR